MYVSNFAGREDNATFEKKKNREQDYAISNQHWVNIQRNGMGYVSNKN